MLPTTLAIGEAIMHVRTQMRTEQGLALKYTFSGGEFFNRMKKLGLYSTDVREVEKRIDAVGMAGIFTEK